MPKMQLFRRFMVLGVVAAGLLAMQLDAQARPFPGHVRRGILKCSAAPQIVINDKLMVTTPSTRIYNDANLIVQPAYLGSVSKVINYTLNNMGQVDKIWILSDVEADTPIPKKEDAGPQPPRLKVAT